MVTKDFKFLTMELILTCRRCRRVSEIMVDPADIKRWQDGEHIQDALFYLSADQRELIISQTCGVCFDELFEGMDD